MVSRLRHDRLADGANLIDLQQQRVAGIVLLGEGHPVHVGREEVVANELDGAAPVELGPGVPVVLRKGVFDQDDGVVLQQLLVQIAQLVGEQLVRAVRLESDVVQTV